MEVRGPIEAHTTSLVQNGWPRFPRMEVRGPIEAGRSPPTRRNPLRFRGWKSAAPLKPPHSLDRPCRFLRFRGWKSAAPLKPIQIVLPFADDRTGFRGWKSAAPLNRFPSGSSPANKKKDPRYAGIYRDMPGYSGMRPRRLRPMIVGVPPRVGAAYAGIGRRNCGSRLLIHQMAFNSNLGFRGFWGR